MQQLTVITFFKRLKKLAETTLSNRSFSLNMLRASVWLDCAPLHQIYLLPLLRFKLQLVHPVQVGWLPQVPRRLFRKGFVGVVDWDVDRGWKQVVILDWLSNHPSTCKHKMRKKITPIKRSFHHYFWISRLWRFCTENCMVPTQKSMEKICRFPAWKKFFWSVSMENEK